LRNLGEQPTAFNNRLVELLDEKTSREKVIEQGRESPVIGSHMTTDTSAAGLSKALARIASNNVGNRIAALINLEW